MDHSREEKDSTSHAEPTKLKVIIWFEQGFDVWSAFQDEQDQEADDGNKDKSIGISIKGGLIWVHPAR